MNTPCKCEIDGCDKPPTYKDMCAMHHMRVVRHGDPLYSVPRVAHNKGPTVCSINDNECSSPGGKIARGWCKAHYDRWRRHGDPTIRLFGGGAVPMTEHAQWQGDDIGYAGWHDRLRSIRGKASEYTCASCGGPAYEWTYNHGCPEERQSDNRPFCTHPDCYTALCRPCHRLKDAA